MKALPSPQPSFPVTFQAPLFDRLKPALITAPLYILAVFGRSHLSSVSPLWLWIAAIGGFLLIIAGFLSIGFCKVTLYSDRIEKESFFGRMSMKRSEAGKIVRLPQGSEMLTYKYNSSDGIIILRGMSADEVWSTWLDYSKKI